MIKKIRDFISAWERDAEKSYEILNTQNPNWIIQEIVCG